MESLVSMMFSSIGVTVTSSTLTSLFSIMTNNWLHKLRAASGINGFVDMVNSCFC